MRIKKVTRGKGLAFPMYPRESEDDSHKDGVFQN